MMRSLHSFHSVEMTMGYFITAAYEEWRFDKFCVTPL
jgi:hypothetical protein